MTTFPFGPLRIDPVEFASHGNAVLGIRGSGKTYTATALAERLEALWATHKDLPRPAKSGRRMGLPKRAT